MGFQMVQTRASSRGSVGSPPRPADRGDTNKPPAKSTNGSGDHTTTTSRAGKRRVASPVATAPAKKRAAVVVTSDSPDAASPGTSPQKRAATVCQTPEKRAATVCQAPFEPSGQMYVGAHVSGAGGLWKAVREAHDIGARSFALFLASQRTWNRKPLSDEDAERFREAMQTYGYSGDLVVPHGSYLMNLGSPELETRTKSCALLRDELQRCQRLGLPLFNFHPGSTCGKITREESTAHIARGINDALRVTSGVTVLLENMSRQGNTLGGDLRELRAIIDLVEDQDRVGVCLDTCHAHAAGYDLSTEAGFRSLMADFESILGLHRLRAVHLNDSKSPVGSHLDRHENIGKGTIGQAGIARVLADPRFQRLPVVLETPYVDDGIYRREIKLLYEIINT